ncbi:MAG: glycosyltransferase family protein [Nitrospinae bacterium]|nr:glycosyltransferase family protein [Nitrospinota bacterium]
MKTNAIIQARMASTRLPGKVLLPACGKPMLELLIERMRQCRTVDEVWVATTSNPADQAIVDLCESLGVPCHRGSENNVLQRVLECAVASNAGIIVELTGDNPLLDPALVDRMVAIYKQNACDFISNILKPGYPHGMIAQVFSTNLLQKVSDATDDPLDQEHVTRYIHRNPGRFSLFSLEPATDQIPPGLRLTLDTPEDYKLIKIIFENLYPARPGFSFGDILGFLDARPELVKINTHVRQKSE